MPHRIALDGGACGHDEAASSSKQRRASLKHPPAWYITAWRPSAPAARRENARLLRGARTLVSRGHPYACSRAPASYAIKCLNIIGGVRIGGKMKSARPIPGSSES